MPPGVGNGGRTESGGQVGGIWGQVVDVGGNNVDWKVGNVGNGENPVVVTGNGGRLDGKFVITGVVVSGGWGKVCCVVVTGGGNVWVGKVVKPGKRVVDVGNTIGLPGVGRSVAPGASVMYGNGVDVTVRYRKHNPFKWARCANQGNKYNFQHSSCKFISNIHYHKSLGNFTNSRTKYSIYIESTNNSLCYQVRYYLNSLKTITIYINCISIWKSVPLYKQHFKIWSRSYLGDWCTQYEYYEINPRSTIWPR